MLPRLRVKHTEHDGCLTEYCGERLWPLPFFIGVTFHCDPNFASRDGRYPEGTI